MTTPVAGAFKRLACWLHLPAKITHDVTVALAHMEHAGGAVVGLDFISRHAFGPVSLGIITFVILAVRVMAKAES